MNYFLIYINIVSKCKRVERLGSDIMENMANTQYFKVNNSAEITVKDILEAVYIALTEKGYNPGS